MHLSFLFYFCVGCNKISSVEFLVLFTCKVNYKVIRHSLAYLTVHKWLVGDVPIYLKFWAKITQPVEQRRL